MGQSFAAESHLYFIILCIGLHVLISKSAVALFSISPVAAKNIFYCFQ
jgi:hypothetical protein